MAAKAAVAAFLAECPPTPMLFDVSCVADKAAIATGKRKGELFPSLYDYECLLPDTHTARWQRTAGDGGIMRVFPRSEVPTLWSPTPGAFDAGIDMGPGNHRRQPTQEFERQARTPRESVAA